MLLKSEEKLKEYENNEIPLLESGRDSHRNRPREQLDSHVSFINSPISPLKIQDPEP